MPTERRSTKYARRGAVAILPAVLAACAGGGAAPAAPAPTRVDVSVAVARATRPGSAAGVEQTSPGGGPAPVLVESFDGLGIGFQGPQGPGFGGNPSDNTLAVGPDHIVQIVNSRMAIFTKKGKRFGETGRALYGAVPTNNVFRGFGGACEAHDNGDAVIRYDQLADRWLLVMPIFTRLAYRPDQPTGTRPGDPAALSVPAIPGQPGPATPLFQPTTRTDTVPPPRRPPTPEAATQEPQGVFAMCYAVSASPDPLGAWYRYEFLRPYFPDYPRPAVWPDGYYVPTSTGDNRISPTIATQKHACVAERAQMLRGEPAREQCLIVENVNFLNNADLDGRALPPRGAPNLVLAAGGRQLDGILEDSVILAWRFHVDWRDPARTRLIGPDTIPVAPYHYLCGGQLTSCVPQPGTDRRLDAQGDKIMARVVYRRIGERQSVVAVHSVDTSGGGGVRWYELDVGRDGGLHLLQQGTYLGDGLYRWMASPAIDRLGNIGIGYSFGGGDRFPGQRFAGRRPSDPPGQLALAEAVLAEGQAAQTNTMRWEDYAQTAVDPTDDCTIWYVGDYLKAGATSYSTRIGAFRLPGCGR